MYRLYALGRAWETGEEVADSHTIIAYLMLNPFTLAADKHSLTISMKSSRQGIFGKLFE